MSVSKCHKAETQTKMIGATGAVSICSACGKACYLIEESKTMKIDDQIKEIISYPCSDSLRHPRSCPCEIEKVKALFVSIIGECLEEGSKGIFKTQNKKQCQCKYNKDGLRMGECYRCFENDMAAFWRGKDKFRQQFLNNLREKGLEVGKE